MGCKDRLVIAIGGFHGTGKSTYAKALAKTFGLRHVSAGGAFRKLAEKMGLTLKELGEKAARDRSIDEMIDNMVREEALKGGVVVDGMLAAWMAENAHIKICLTAPDKVRFERIAKRDNISLEEAERFTLERERVEKERYKRYYGINVEDLTVYDVIFNTELLPLENSIKILENIIREYLSSKMEC
mgnify:CR=1 FL=1